MRGHNVFMRTTRAAVLCRRQGTTASANRFSSLRYFFHIGTNKTSQPCPATCRAQLIARTSRQLHMRAKLKSAHPPVSALRTRIQSNARPHVTSFTTRSCRTRAPTVCSSGRFRTRIVCKSRNLELSFKLSSTSCPNPTGTHVRLRTCKRQRAKCTASVCLSHGQ